MSTSLEKANIRRMKKYLSLFTAKVPLATLTGTVLTALVQSSTAITVITVGLVNSGMLKLTQAVGIIYGANIGTTITAQLMSFKLTNGAFVIIVLGILIAFFSKRKSLANMGWALTGLGIMFAGLNILNSGVPYIKENQNIYELFRIYGQNPIIGLLIGMVTTMLVQSSSATVGLTIVLFNAGLIGFESALGLTLGDNIGTCITAQLSSIGASIWAKRTAWAHTLYNVIGVIIAFILLAPFASMVQAITYGIGQDKTRLIANAHTIFNILSAVIFLPLTKYYVKFLEWLIRENK
ncbi:sodium-dependent phosphate transporter [Acetivibrio straminisolvens JCM 21531]|uniref:Sodium-dependent phosphate transporter n=2 Tax=Acetivibrio straminisolvens TaxID=253314 RepID=W4V764_9FIRM|nr:sodium-dependent phosphate transporter [Acetivibrio straminisolvens JCM 21531]